MATKIGYQDGIEAFFDWYREQPGVPQRGPGYDPNDMSTWPWVDKLERTLRILKDDHDAGVVTPPKPPEPPVPPVQTYVKVAPRATNLEGGSNVQFCMFNEDGSLRPGVRETSPGKFTDESGAIYSESKQDSGVRDESYHVDGLPGSRSMDSRSPCQCLKDAGYPGDPTQNTGAWHI